MIKAIIIDDEPLARSIVKEYLADYPQITIVDESNDGFEGLKAIATHKPDLIFLDIQMPKINGFEMLELITDPPAIIFTTAFDEYALKAFETHAVDYLLKPYSKQRFKNSIDNWLNQKEESKSKAKAFIEKVDSPSQHERVVVKTGGRIKVIPVGEILFIEASDDYVKIHCIDGMFLKNKTLGFFEDVLDKSLFIRTHRSYLLNISEVTRLVPYEKENFLAILKNGSKVPVSKAGYTKLRSVLGL